MQKRSYQDLIGYAYQKSAGHLRYRQCFLFGKILQKNVHDLFRSATSTEEKWRHYVFCLTACSAVYYHAGSSFSPLCLIPTWTPWLAITKWHCFKKKRRLDHLGRLPEQLFRHRGSDIFYQEYIWTFQAPFSPAGVICAEHIDSWVLTVC
jgi:hypothetical protein